MGYEYRVELTARCDSCGSEQYVGAATSIDPQWAVSVVSHPPIGWEGPNYDHDSVLCKACLSQEQAEPAYEICRWCSMRIERTGPDGSWWHRFTYSEERGPIWCEENPARVIPTRAEP